MKTTKALFTAILVLMTLGIFAQEEQGLFVSVEYSEQLNRFETWVSQVQDHFTHRANREAGLPVISQTFYTEYADVFYEDDYSMKTWMSTPFEEGFLEAKLDLEYWMSTPFETIDLEEGPSLEKWMLTPFETQEELEVEEWMTVALWE